VVLIPCVDQYTTQDNQILAANLYVAMTWARSWLAMYSVMRGDPAARRLHEVIESCTSIQSSVPLVDASNGEEE
jgi:hypothetical protein